MVSSGGGEAIVLHLIPEGVVVVYMACDRRGNIVGSVEYSIELIEEGGGIFSSEFILESLPDGGWCFVGGQQNKPLGVDRFKKIGRSPLVALMKSIDSIIIG